MPTILHASWIVANSPDVNGYLFLWAEESDGIDPRARPVTLAGQKHLMVSRAPLHVRLVAPALLRHRLQGVLATFQPEMLPLQRLSVSVPDSPQAGQPSQPLQELRVFGVALPVVQALYLLRVLQTPPDGRLRNSVGDQQDALITDFVRHFIIGTDLRYWCIAAQYARSLIRAGCVLPSLHVRDDQLQVRWETWNDWASFALNLEELATLMPGVCLSYELNRQYTAEASVLLQDFLHAAVHTHMSAAAVALQDDTQYVPVTGVDEKIMGARDLTPLWYRLLLGEAIPRVQVGQDCRYFVHQWNQWLARVCDLSQGRVQVVLTLREPSAAAAESGAEPWCLAFGIRLPEAPDHTLDADELWHQWEQVRPGSGHSTRPGAYLLAGLRMASHMCAPITRVLHEPQPIAVTLSHDEAYQFLTQDSQVLAQAGFQITLPAWWTSSPDTALQLQMLIQDTDTSIQNAAEAVDVHSRNFNLDWNLVAADRELSTTELGQLATADSLLVFMNDRWLHVNEDQIRAARQILAYRTRPQKVSLIRALHLVQEQGTPHGQAQLLSQFGDTEADFTSTLPVHQVALQGRLREVWHRLQHTARDASRTEPRGFVGQLRPYQKRGLAWLWYMYEIGLGSCLADDMGLGKTIQTIALFLEQERIRPPHIQWPRLLICPASVMRNWQRELARFAPTLNAYIHHGPQRLQGPELQKCLASFDVVITSFGTARVDQNLLRSIAWHSLIVDEAQNIKNPLAKQSRAIRSFPGQHRLTLTGTPLENHLLELWSILDFLNADYLGSQTHFQQRFVHSSANTNGRERLHDLKHLVQPFVLRRLKSDPEVVRDLPAKHEINIFCDLTPEQTHLYAQAVEQALPRLQGLEGIRRHGTILALITRLRKIVNHPAMLEEEPRTLEGRSGKLIRFMEMLAEARENQDKALVFTTFVRMGEILQQLIQQTWQCETDFLHGGVSMRARQQMVDQFQQGGQDRPVLLLSVRTGGVGLNLTAANHVYHYDRWWNPAVENQATDRAHRIGQTRRVQVFKYIMSGTVEEHVDNLLQRKAALAQDVLGSGEEWLTRMTHAQLQDLLMLRLPTVLQGTAADK